MRSLVLVLALTLGCGVTQQQDQTTEKIDQAKPNPIPTIINGNYATLYTMCDGVNKVYYAEGYNKVAVEVVKDGCPDGR